MARVAPTILAATPQDYGERIDRVKPFAKRLHVDVCDGVFIDTRTVSLSQIYGIDGVVLDLHLMMARPDSQIEHIASLQPSLVIIHHEADIDRRDFYKQLQALGIRVGLAIGHDTTIDQVGDELQLFDHLLIFTGTLGHNAGEFHIDCLDKLTQARKLNPRLEFGVDGGIDLSTGQLAIEAGANVLDCGAYIHDAQDPEQAYRALERVAGDAA